MVKKYGFSGPQAIAWVRMCRPGSIIGGQQVYINRYADELQKKSIKSSQRKKSPPKINNFSSKQKSSLANDKRQSYNHNSSRNTDNQVLSPIKNQAKKLQLQNEALKPRP